MAAWHRQKMYLCVKKVRRFSFYLDNTINCFCIIRSNLLSVVETVVYLYGTRVGRNVTGRRGVEKEACV